MPLSASSCICLSVCRLGKSSSAAPEPERFARAILLSPFDPRTSGMRAGTASAHFFLGRYDEAASWAEMALQDNPDFQSGLRYAAVSNAMAGRPEQAHKAMARLRQLNPALRVSTLKDLVGHLRPEDLSRYEGLRHAGLPEHRSQGISPVATR
jgi:tetratricopeptide (TPR) repeat protein